MGHREYFNALADNWDELCRHDSNRIDYLLDLTRIAEGDRVLDVGTGTGVLLPYLQERVGPEGRVDAVDLAEGMLSVASSRHAASNTSFIHGDALRLTEVTGRYDQIICYSVFPHFREKELAVATLARYLTEGGRLTVGHTQGRETINSIHRNGGPEIAADHLPEMGILRSYFESAGLVPLFSIDSENLFVISGMGLRRCEGGAWI